MMQEMAPYHVSLLAIVFGILVMSGVIYLLRNKKYWQAGGVAGIIGGVLSVAVIFAGTGDLKYSLAIPVGILGACFSATLGMYTVILRRSPASESSLTDFSCHILGHVMCICYTSCNYEVF